MRTPLRKPQSQQTPRTWSGFYPAKKPIRKLGKKAKKPVDCDAASGGAQELGAEPAARSTADEDESSGPISVMPRAEEGSVDESTAEENRTSQDWPASPAAAKSELEQSHEEVVAVAASAEVESPGREAMSPSATALVQEDERPTLSIASGHAEETQAQGTPSEGTQTQRTGQLEQSIAPEDTSGIANSTTSEGAMLAQAGTTEPPPANETVPCQPPPYDEAEGTPLMVAPGSLPANPAPSVDEFGVFAHPPKLELVPDFDPVAWELRPDPVGETLQPVAIEVTVEGVEDGDRDSDALAAQGSPSETTPPEPSTSEDPATKALASDAFPAAAAPSDQKEGFPAAPVKEAPTDEEAHDHPQHATAAAASHVDAGRKTPTLGWAQLPELSPEDLEPDSFEDLFPVREAIVITPEIRRRRRKARSIVLLTMGGMVALLVAAGLNSLGRKRAVASEVAQPIAQDVPAVVAEAPAAPKEPTPVGPVAQQPEASPAVVNALLPSPAPAPEPRAVDSAKPSPKEPKTLRAPAPVPRILMHPNVARVPAAKAAKPTAPVTLPIQPSPSPPAGSPPKSGTAAFPPAPVR